MKQKIMMLLGISLFILFLVGTIISSSRNSISIRSNGGNGRGITINNKNKNNSNDGSHKNNKNANLKNILKGNRSGQGDEGSIDYFMIAIICLLLATGMSIILIIVLVIFLIFRHKNKYKTI